MVIRHQFSDGDGLLMLAITMTFFPFLARSTPAKGIDGHLLVRLQQRWQVEVRSQGWMHGFINSLVASAQALPFEFLHNGRDLPHIGYGGFLDGHAISCGVVGAHGMRPTDSCSSRFNIPKSRDEPASGLAPGVGTAIWARIDPLTR